MKYLGKISSSMSMYYRGKELPVYYLGNNSFSLVRVYGKK